GASFDAVAKELGVSAEPARFVGRTDPAIPAQIRSVVFDVPKPAADKPVYRALKLDRGGAALLAVMKLRVDSAEANKQLQASRTQQAIERQGMGEAIAYLEDVRRTADVRKNPKAFE
ncbi:MAG: hypothetical protein ACREU6_07950, partial [Steroidobacteraceae bacterium]